MVAPTQIIILPGFDGTGLMLDAFAAEMQARGHGVKIITYPTSEALSYEALQAFITRRLPDQDYILIGESFSGPLALRIAASNPPRLKGVVLVASFARFDYPGKKLLGLLARLLPPRAVPLALLNVLMMNGSATREQKRLLREAISSVAPAVLRLRAQDALAIDLTRENIRLNQPLLYLHATNDRLMPSHSGEGVLSLAANARIETVPAPHFMLQAEPGICATVITEFISNI